ncbi:MAG: hypothetical protein V8T62_03270 [Oscillospiraceae bacterium]
MTTIRMKGVRIAATRTASTFHVRLSVASITAALMSAGFASYITSNVHYLPPPFP